MKTAFAADDRRRPAGGLRHALIDAPTPKFRPRPRPSTRRSSPPRSWYDGSPAVAPISIYQQNVYVGTDVDAVIAAGATSSSDPAVLFGALLGALNTFDATDWKARASRMADEIRRQGPDVISLNEISTIVPPRTRRLWRGGQYHRLPAGLSRRALAGASPRLSGGGPGEEHRGDDPAVDRPATGEIISGPDGLPAASPRWSTMTFCSSSQGFAADNVTTKNYQAYLPVNLGPIPVAIKRGYVAADVSVRGQDFRVVSTHPEPRTPVKEIQEAQVSGAPGRPLDPRPCRSSSPGTSTPSPTTRQIPPWDQMTRAGFTDLWTARLGRPQPGATCCHSPDLSSATDARPPARLCLGPSGRGSSGGSGWS